MGFVLPDLVSTGGIVASAWGNAVRAALGESAPAKVTAAGDMIVGVDAGEIDVLPVGSEGQLLTIASGAPAWADPSITTAEAMLSGDSTVSTSYGDVVSVALGVGTWLIFASALVSFARIGADGTDSVAVKLWDGVTVKASAATSARVISTDAGANHLAQVTLVALAQLSNAATWKVSAISESSALTCTIKAANPFGGAGNNATYIRAVKLLT